MTPIDRRLIFSLNWPLLLLVAALFSLGALNLYSASGVRVEDGLALNPYYQKQVIWGLAGLFCMILVMLPDYRHLKLIAWPLMLLTLILLAMVPIMGKSVYGAKRWLDLGVMSFQPSELAKISVLILASRMLSEGSGKLGWLGLFSVLAACMVPAAMVTVQPDLGSGLNIMLLLAGLILYRGLTGGVFKTLLVAIPAVMPLAWRFLKPYQKQRILTFLNPENDPLGSGYHIIQSQIAVGSGKLWGKGYLEGSQSQLRFLPEKHTDFAVAVFSEEWGFIGMIVLLSLFALFLLRIYVSARDAKDRFGSFLCAGVFFYFFWQILINIGMVIGLMPVVGIPLPFISYGGSATIVNFCLIGLVQNVSMRRYVFKKA
jgi:rod shape determining protein RodA